MADENEASFSDYEFALKFRKVMQRIAVEEIEKARPRYQYATVVSIDRTNSKCTIQYPGDPATVKVNMGAVQPTAAGQIVRVAGLLGDRYIDDILGFFDGGGVPAGAIVEWPIAAIPGGWLLANGQLVSRTVYAALFARYGTQYGVGDGSTTFGLPNRKGRVVIGLDAAQTEFDTLGETGGVKTHVHTSDAHTHPLSMAGQARMTWLTTGKGLYMQRVASAAWTSSIEGITATPLATGSSTAQTTGAALFGATDSTTPADTGSTVNLPPYTVSNFIIKT